MKSFVILALVGACIHLSTSKEPDKEDKQEYSGPVVYSNLPPPVLYFPNFPEKPEVSRGDEEDKKVEYIPFPYKDLPLLVYQSDNQPPVHVVEKPSANQEDSAYSGPAVYQYSDYVQNETPVDESKEQHLSDVYPDLANQQYISIGVSTYHDDSPPQQNVAYNVQKTASQPSQAQNGGQQQAMQQQSGGQYGGNQGEMQQMAVGQYETLNAKPQQNGGQYPIQQQQPSSGQYASQSTSQQQSGDQQQQRGGQYASPPIAIPLQYGGQYQVQAAPVAQQQNGGQYASAVQQQQNDGQYANTMQQQNGGQYPGPKQQPNGGQYNNVMQHQNGGLYAGPKQQQQNGGQYINAIQQQNSGVYASAMQQQNGGQYLTPNAMKQQNIAQYASAMQQQNQKQQSPAPGQYIPNVVPTQNQQQHYIPTQNQGIIYAPAQSIQHTSPKEPQNVMMQNIAQQYGNQPKQNVAPQMMMMMMNAYQGQQQVVNNLPQQQYQAQMVEVKKEQQAIVKQALGMPNLPIIYPPQQNNNYQFPKPSQQPPRNMIPPKTMPKNTPQAMPVKEQSHSEALQNGPYVSIGVYPYEGKHEPQQVFTFVIPQDLQKPENDEDSKPLYQDKRRPEMSEQKKPQQPTRYKDPSVEEESRYQPKDLYMMQQQQQVGKNGNNNNRAKPQEPKPQQQQQQYQKKQNNQPQPTKSSSDEEDPQVEYQHILIHIPHGGVSQPQISVVQGSEENQKIRNSEVPQRIPEEQVQKNYPEEREYPRVFKGTPADLDQEMPKFPIEAYSGSESKLYPQRNPFPRRRPHFNRQNFERYGQGRSTVPRHRGVGRDEYVAEPSFHVQRVLSPGILESSNITDFKFLDDPESEVYYEDAKELHGYRGQNLVDDTAAKLFASQAVPYSHNEFHQGFSKVKTGHTAMELMRVLPVPFPMHPPVSFRPLPVVPYLPYNYQSGQRFLPRHPAYNANRPKGSQKYGGFFRKLVASFLGVRHPISNREGTRDGEPPIPPSAIIRTDHRGLDGIPIPLTPTRRMSSAPSQMPPIIVYKGKQPPIEVYGSKDDIETMKADKRSDEDEEVLDAVLSELANEGEFSEKSVEDDPLVVLESPKESNTTDPSSPLDADSWSAAFKEDLKELVSLLPKEENSDLLSP